MSKLISILTITLCLSKVTAQVNDTSLYKIISKDITNFWEAYDAIQNASDTIEQMSILMDKFIEPATDGQKKMMEVRAYKPIEYLEAIQSFPKFWNSIRTNTENLKKHNEAFHNGLQGLEEIYPDMRPANIYYTMGVFRSPGTGVDSFALIGTEYALGDLETNIEELDERRQNYFKMNPIEHLQILIVHEYIHTQQAPIVNNLLCETLYEGIAEFVAQLATQAETPHKAFVYGPANEETVRLAFERDMFRTYAKQSWIWNSSNNEFGTNDMSYFVGHSIARMYYEKALDKNEAIKHLIELDFTNDKEVEELVDGTGYFSASIEELYKQFETTRPQVVRILEFENNSQEVDPNKVESLTFIFSEALNGFNTSVDFGPLGKDYFPSLSMDRKWAEDGLSWSVPVKLEPATHYQFLISNNFRTNDGRPLKPYLVEFKTK